MRVDPELVDRARRDGQLNSMVSGCLKKQVYKTRRHAEKVALWRVEEEPGLELGVYVCRYCGFYHLTSSPANWGLEVILGSKTIVDVVPCAT